MFRKLRRHFLDWPLATKFVSVFLVLILLSCGLTIAALHRGLSVYEKRQYEQSLKELDFYVQSIDDELLMLDDLTRSIAVDSEIQAKLEDMMATDHTTAAYYYKLTRLRPIFLDKIYQGGQTDGMQYTDVYGHTISIGLETADPGVERREALEKELEEKHGGFAMLPPTEKYPYIVCGRKILRSRNVSLDDMGTIIVTVDVRTLLSHQINRLSYQPTQLYLYNGSELVYSNVDEGYLLPESESEQGYEIVKLGGSRYYVCWITSATTGLRLCSVFDYNEIYGQTNHTRNLLILGECLLCLLFAWVTVRLTRLVTQPLQTLSTAVQVVENGDFAKAREVLPQGLGTDEVGTLTHEFDTMLGAIDTLIHENYEKQIKLQETRYKMLQAQINPHFLYNTLSTLSWLVRAEKNEDADNLIINLGKMLRAAFSHTQNTTAAEDVQLARSYIEIQKLRYKRRAQITLTESDNLEAWYLPYFTLQPLVENAIHYGVESSDDVCIVQVSACADADTLTLTVQNTGEVIPREKVAEIQAFKAKPRGNGIGMKNIYERLAMMYENFTFTFDNAADTGTTVCITLHKTGWKGALPDAENPAG